MEEREVYIEAVTGERKRKPPWMLKLNYFFDDIVHRIWHGYGLEYDKPEQKEKLEKIYNSMMEDIQLSDAPDAIKEGLDPLPGMMGLLLMAAGGGAIAQIMGSLLTPYIQSKLTYPMNKMATPFRLDPGTITRLWLRGFPDEEKKELWWSDLKDQGWDEDRVNAAKELAHYLPSPTEVMTWAAREVFEPELREKFQLDKFLPPEFLEWAGKVGITGEVAKNYWAAHWVLPSLTEVIELWRRKIWDKETVDAFWTELDMVPWVREDLFKLFKAVPTRVDVRRWWDMRTIDEPRLREIYQAQGYWDRELEDYVVWTKVYTDFPDLIARYKNGWITEEEVLSQLLADGMPEDRAKELLETKIKKVVGAERVAPERDLTKSEIYRGVKKDIISAKVGVEMLMEMGYDHDEAAFIIDVNVAAAGSPETPMEFRQLVESYKRSQGMSAKEIPQEVIDAEKALLSTEGLLKGAVERGAPQDEIDNLEVQRAEQAARYRELLILHGL